ncbi:MAG: endonuclease [Candidatus Eremiobacteraeota bacterium]|nr:endonuclease [Candidatus Eremiobacteraeota bacterium]
MNLLSVGSAWNIAPGLKNHFARPAAEALCKHPHSDGVADRVDFDLRRGGHSKPPSAPAPAPTPIPAEKYYDAKGDAAARQKYYGDSSRFDSMSPSELYSELSSLVQKTHKALDYDPAQYLYPEVDRHQDGQIYCIYSGGGLQRAGEGLGDQPLKEGQYNCEHVVPQSWFSKKRAPRGDLHHLFAAQIDCNSLRGNAEYDDKVDEGQEMKLCGVLDQHQNLFEPKAGKAETARAVLYFMLCYPGMIGDRRGEYTAEDIPMLVEWANEHPPTQYEQHRNQYIEKLQGNRNPLIDFPELINKVDFTKGLGQIREGR